MQDQGEERPASCPLRVGYCHERQEYVEFWIQENKQKDKRVLSVPTKRTRGEFGYAYMMRRSRGTCFDANNQRLLFKIHCCQIWPCPSDYRDARGQVNVSKWAGLVPWHLVPQEGTYDAVVVAEEGPAVAASNVAAAVAAEEELAVASAQAEPAKATECAASDAAAAVAASEELGAQEELAVAASDAAAAVAAEEEIAVAAAQDEPAKAAECVASDAAAAVAVAMVASSSSLIVAGEGGPPQSGRSGGGQFSKHKIRE